MHLKSLIYALTLGFMLSPSLLAMKRAPDQIEDNRAIKHIKLEEPVELKWYSYAEFLTLIYDTHSWGLKQKLQYLESHVLSKTITMEGQEIFQAWISPPKAPDVLISLCPTVNGYSLYASKADKDEDGLFMGGSLIFSSTILLEENQETINIESHSAEEGNCSVKELFNELFFHVPLNFTCCTQKILNIDDFFNFLNSLKNKPLISIMRAFNNGSVVHTDNTPLKIKLKDNVTLMMELKLTKYKSNGLAEKNFIKPESDIGLDSLLYYQMTLSVWDEASQTSLPTAAAVLYFPLDAGYGNPHLPSEIFWISRSDNLSGKEILEFLERIFRVIEPKVIYLNDEASIDSKLDLRIIRPLVSGQTFYAEYGHFDVLDCTNFESHQGMMISQSKLSYEESLNFFVSLSLKDFKSALKPGSLKNISGILQKHGACAKLSDLLKILFEEHREKESNDLLSVYAVLINAKALNNSSTAQKIDKHMQTFWDTRLWKCDAYQNPLLGNDER